MYSIVEFPDNSVGIVSNTWLNDDVSMTLWPPYADPSKFRMVLLMHEVPGTTWTMHEITILATAGGVFPSFPYN